MKSLLFKRMVLGLALGFMLAGGYAVSPSVAGDLPTAAGSPIAGISFDDHPLILPVQRNFQMAMLTVSSELGRSCGKMEAYGWRMDGQEQDRVNLIFNNTVDRMRAQGYDVASKTSPSVSRDITLFTADRTDRHLIFLWSAGEIGLVMVLCDTSAPITPLPTATARDFAEASQPANLPSRMPVAASNARAKETAVAERQAREDFSPIGRWVGDYTCSQGTTGATLQIDKVRGDQFEGSFSFYPTAKNPYVPKGKYMVFGEYDADSQRILVNPGKWVERPKDFYSTIMIGSFDSTSRTFSGYFQGITGCTSFEAGLDRASARPVEKAKPVKAIAKTESKPKVKKQPTAKTTTKTSAATKATTEKALTEKAAASVPADKTSVPDVPKASVPSLPAATATPSAPAKSRSSAFEPPAGIAVSE